jgi:nitric oxide reductase subunit C
MNTHSKRLIFFGLVFSFFIYSFTVYTSGTANDKGASLITEQSKKGKLLFQDYNCTSCHQIYGLGGYMGPDLTNVISAKGKGPIYAKALLQGGSARMPNFHLSEDEMNAFIAYLTYVDKTGVSPVLKFKTNADGTIDQK